MKKKIIITISIILLLLILIPTIVFFTSNIKMNLKGKENITLRLGEKYKDEGATSKFIFWNLDVKTTNNINENKIGTYTINYSSKILNKKENIKRTITIVDKDKPTITLTGNKEISIYVDGKYEEPGYTANDNYDGDITNKVSIENNLDNTKVGSYEIKYKVLDSSNNEYTEIRTIKVVEKPVINTPISTPKKGSGLPVLMYHFFYDPDAGETGKDTNWMNIKDFEEQVKYLTDEGYYFPSWQEVIDYVDGKNPLPEKSVVITADDGNESFFRLAIPIIRKYNAKATGFIVGAWTSKETLANYSDIYFESHTYNMHRAGCSGMGHGGYFNCVSYDEGVQDLKLSIDNVGDNKAIAYPFGDVNDNVKKITKDAGIILGFTTAYGKVYPGMDKLQLPRVRMSDGTSLTAFKNKV